MNQKPARRSESQPIPAAVRARIAFVRGFLTGWMRLFGLDGLYRLGRFFGTCEYLTDYNRRRRVHARLRLFFEESADAAWRRRVTHRYFMRIRCDKMFYTIMDRIPRDTLLGRMNLIGRERLDRALADGKGAFVALCHYGSHHIAGLTMALLGYRIAGVRDPKESYVRRYIQERYRETFPEVAQMTMFYSNVFPREIYRYYRENQIVASLLDVDSDRGQKLTTQTVRFLGEDREFLTGPLRIAWRQGAPVLQGFVISRPGFHYDLVVAPVLIERGKDADEAQEIAGAMQRYADRVAQHAREHPDHLMKI